MGPRMNPMSFMTFAKKQALRGRTKHHTLLSKMVWLKERIVRLWKLFVPCSMIKGFRSFYGPKLQIQSYMFKTDALIKHWIPRLPKRCSLVRNLMSLIYKFWKSRIFSCAERKKKQIGCILKEENLCGL